MAADAGPRRAVLMLADPAARDPAMVGAKAAALGVLASDGFPIPAGFVITVPACSRISTAGEVVPLDLQPAIATAVKAIGAAPFAVRSSAVAEDSAGASYAGMYTSVLDVNGDADDLEELCAAIRKVVESASSERVRSYRARGGNRVAGRTATGDGIAVLVQRQVPAAAAGVAFTADPISGDRDRTLVSAVRGLGDRLASGEATPQEWVVRDGRPTQTSPGAGQGGGALTPAQAVAVAALAERVATVEGVPQDVEWALADGVVHLLQTRPITALPMAPAIELPRGSWIKESGRRAELITPFGASVALPIVSVGLASAFAEGGSLLERIEMRSIGGEVYLRIVAVGDRSGGSGSAPPWWLLGVLARIAPPLRARCRAARRAVDPGSVRRLVEQWVTRGRAEIIEATAALRGLDVTAMSDDELAAHLDDVIALTARGLGRHFELMPPYALAVHELVTTCHELIGWDATQALELLSGISTVTSEPTRALDDVAALVADEAPVREVLENPGPDVRARLRAVDESVGIAFNAWCERYGWRVLGEDPGAPTLAEQPELLASLLRDAMSRPAAVDDVVESRRNAAIATARSELSNRNPAAAQRFENALAAASLVYPTREDSGVWAGCHPAGLVRRAVLEIGRRLLAAGVLDRSDDVVLLDVETVRAALGGVREGVAEKVARARAERAWVAAHPGPRFHGPPPGRSPDIRGLPAAARRMNAALLWSERQQHTSPKPADREGTLRGAPGSGGRHTGPARIVAHFDEFSRVRPGDVLVCPATDPSWSVLFGVAGAVVTEGGGALSHAAIVAREYGVPAVLAVDSATRMLRDGQLVTVDGTAGSVRIVDSSDPDFEGAQ